MNGFITYAPLFRYLKVHEISHEQFMADMGFDASMLEMLLGNQNVAIDILENICIFYGLPLNMVATMDYELPRWKDIGIPREEGQKPPTLKAVMKSPLEYIKREIFRVNEIRFLDSDNGSVLLRMMLEPKIEDDPEAFFKAIEGLECVYNPERLQKWFKTLLDKNPNFINGLDKILCTGIYWLLEPVERDPVKNKTNIIYSHGVLALACDTSKLKKTAKAKSTTTKKKTTTTRKKKEEKKDA